MGVAVAVLVAGCAGALTARGQVVQPAQVPVRAFPKIVVIASEEPESAELASTIAQHLARGRSVVDRLERAELDRLREAGGIERATVIIDVRALVTRGDRPELAQGERLDCGPNGCMDWRRTESTPVIRADVRLSVADGPSGRTLQEVELSEEESGVDAVAVRLRVLARVAERTLALLDQRVEEVRVHLYPIDHPTVRGALASMRDGRWEEGRRALESFVRTRTFRALPTDQRAFVLYDLGQARRFDVSVPADQRFDAADRALRAAVRLVPQPLFARAVAELEAHRRNRDMVRVQQEAMAHNFGLSPSAEAPPAPSY